MFKIVFPPLCLHCQTKLPNQRNLFCKGCAGFFELIDVHSRCPYCFAENGRNIACKECIQKKKWQVKIASALDYLGPVSTLVKKLKYGKMPYLAKTAVAFMTAQFFRLEWPLPDIIIPVPSRFWFQKSNHAYLIARRFAQELKTDFSSPVKRKVGEFSQVRLLKEQRERLSSHDFTLKKTKNIEDRIVLIVDDVATTGTTLHNTARALREGSPRKIYALTFARAIN